MNTHLTDEERLAYIEGRASTETTAHIKDCATCAAEIQSWRRSIQRLEDLEWPARAPRRATIHAPIFKLAAAAALAICIGFAFGRFSTPNAAEIKAEIERDLHKTLLAELQKPADPQPNTTAIVAALNELRQQQATHYLSLRKDLETLASTADARIQLATRRIAELDSIRQFSSDPIQ